MKLRLLLKYFTLFEIGQLAFSRLFRLHHFYLLQKHLKNEEWSSRTIVSLPDIGLMEEEDVHRIEKTLATYSFEDRKELFIRISFWKDGFKNCYIVRKNGEIAYMQWIITQKENKLLRKKVGSIYQPLQEKQVDRTSVV
jgi:hypothetical protein